jgi:hypothetical protein
LVNDLYLTAYFVGSRSSTNGPVISEVANAEGENPTIAPNLSARYSSVFLLRRNTMIPISRTASTEQAIRTVEASTAFSPLSDRSSDR